MPIKLRFTRRFIERTLAIIAILLLPFIAVLPLSLREKIMFAMADFFWPLVRSMLVPATQRDPHKGKPLELFAQNFDSESATILFGGNDCLRNEVAPLVHGIAFFDGTVFQTTQRPLLLMPLLEASTEKQYIDKVFNIVSAFLSKLPRLKKVYIVGHSLGAAITIQLTAEMRRRGPQSLQYFLALDRSFSSLSEVALYLYPLSGKIMARTLALLWHFQSAQTLQQLAADESVYCQIYQISPDHVIGDAELIKKLRVLFKGREWPERWSYKTLQWPEPNNAHIYPFSEAFSLEAYKSTSDKNRQDLS
jgi:hypothetical protein